jgi:hypothetical protein
VIVYAGAIVIMFASRRPPGGRADAPRAVTSAEPGRDRRGRDRLQGHRRARKAATS